MLTKFAVLWMVFAAVMGFAVGGVFVYALLAPQATIDQGCSEGESTGSNCDSPEKRHEAAEAAISYYTKWLMSFTGAMAVATIILGIATILLYLSSEKQFAALNRPEISVHAIELKRAVGPTEPDLVSASLLCFNKGRTVAKDIEVRGQLLLTNKLEIDVQRTLVKSIRSVESGQKLRVEFKSERTFRDLAGRVRLRRDVIATGNLPSMYCVGTISYFDSNGMRRETGFCYILTFDHIGERWAKAESPEHEYEY